MSLVSAARRRPLNRPRLARRSLRHYAASNAAIALGVAAATAVLVGALLVGDSMRGSLRAMTLQRLGFIDDVLLADHFFRSSLADGLLNEPGGGGAYAAAIPVILLPQVVVETSVEGRIARSSEVQLLAVPEEIWSWSLPRPALPGDDDVVVNRQLAESLGLAETARPLPRLTLRLAIPQQLSSDSALGRTDGIIETLADLRIVDQLPNRGLGRFSMHPTPGVPRTAIVSLDWLQRTLGPRLFKGKSDFRQVNAILLARRAKASPPEGPPLVDRLPLSLEDLGLRLTEVRSSHRAEAESEPIVTRRYWSLSSDRLLFSREAEAAVRSRFPQARPVLTYLANRIQLIRGGQPVGESIPFSTVSGLSETPDEGWRVAPPRDGWQGDSTSIVLNSWAADQLQASPGQTIRLAYFEPETAHGRPIERTVDLTLAGIVELREPADAWGGRGRKTAARFDGPPSWANDPDLTPFVPGLTDAATIENWELPFPTPGIRPVDDTYWENHRTTPKAFLPLRTAQRFWSSRFGRVTSFQFSRESLPSDQAERQVAAALAQRASDFGFRWVPLKAEGLTASGGSTPFDVLFLALSSFVVFSAALLVMLLFRLALQQRAEQVGLMSALGFRFARIRGIWLSEMFGVALVGGGIGVVLGIGYAQAMLWGLRSWWSGATALSGIDFHGTAASLAGGAAAGVLIALATIAVTLAQARRVPAVSLLVGRIEGAGRMRRRGWWEAGWAAALLAGGSGLLAVAAGEGGEVQAGLFVAGGFCVLGGLLLLARRRLRRGPPGRADGRIDLFRLATLNAYRHPLRSTLIVGLVAVAVFLLIAVTAFRAAPGIRGTAGFDFLATSSHPVFADLSSLEGRQAALRDPSGVEDGDTILSLRWKSGDDASCTNPYAPRQPRVVGVTPAMLAYFDRPDVPQFAWSAVDRRRVSGENGWRVLRGQRDNSGVVDVVLDKNTAWYSLKVFSVGSTFEIAYDDGPRVTFRVVGLLDNSVLQGSLILHERDFVRLFPDQAGYRFFLIRAAGDPQRLMDHLENEWSDQGLDGRLAVQMLRELLAVQNTYLAAFQALAGLGLVLGTVGLGAVQARSVLERRRELALLRAVGFRAPRLMRLVFLENVCLLAAGMAVGFAAALVALVPHAWFGGARLPVGMMIGLLIAELSVGGLTVLAASRSILRGSILQALRDP